MSPSWAAEPAGTFSLEVIKDGCVLETIDVSARSHYILGRHASTADVVISHPSVSRQHAVLQHSHTGEVFLMDLDSTHGTSINKKSLTPRTHRRSRASNLDLPVPLHPLCVLVMVML